MPPLPVTPPVTPGRAERYPLSYALLDRHALYPVSSYLYNNKDDSRIPRSVTAG